MQVMLDDIRETLAASQISLPHPETNIPAETILHGEEPSPVQKRISTMTDKDKPLPPLPLGVHELQGIVTSQFDICSDELGNFEKLQLDGLSWPFPDTKQLHDIPTSYTSKLHCYGGPENLEPAYTLL